jgi:3-keto-5-aminohexanoate cleavage enzyme
MNKLIVNLAPTGMIPTKSLTPHVPVRSREIIDEVDRCVPLGVSMVHLHARDEAEAPSYKKELFEEFIVPIRAAHPELVIVVTTSGRNYGEFEKRSAVLELTGAAKPDMASLTLSSLNFNKTASVNSPDMIMRLAETMQARGIKPELEVFDLGMANFAQVLIKKGLLTPPYYFNILLGNVASAQARLLHLGLIVAELPPDSIWAAAGIGDFQLRMNALGLVTGDGVRVGLEDNIWLDEGRTRLASNVQLVERIVGMAGAFGREIATPAEVRGRLKL